MTRDEAASRARKLLELSRSPNAHEAAAAARQAAELIRLHGLTIAPPAALPQPSAPKLLAEDEVSAALREIHQRLGPLVGSPSDWQEFWERQRPAGRWLPGWRVVIAAIRTAVRERAERGPAGDRRWRSALCQYEQALRDAIHADSYYTLRRGKAAKRYVPPRPKLDEHGFPMGDDR